MTDAEKKMSRYTNTVERHLHLPGDVKVRVMSDFISSIAARRESGQTDEEIYGELGDARKVAADLNEQMKEFAYGKSSWRFACLAVALLAGIRILYKGAICLKEAHTMLGTETTAAAGMIGGTDGPTAIFVTFPAWTEFVLPGLLMIAGVTGFLFLSKYKTKK